MEKPTDITNTETAQALTTPSGSGRSSMVTVRISYEKGSANFETHLELNEVPELGVTKDHIVMDAIREISNEWSEMVHDDQNNKISGCEPTDSDKH